MGCASLYSLTILSVTQRLERNKEKEKRSLTILSLSAQFYLVATFSNVSLEIKGSSWWLSNSWVGIWQKENKQTKSTPSLPDVISFFIFLSKKCDFFSRWSLLLCTSEENIRETTFLYYFVYDCDKWCVHVMSIKNSLNYLNLCPVIQLYA